MKVTDDENFDFEVEEGKNEETGPLNKRNMQLIGYNKTDKKEVKDLTQLMMEEIDLTIEPERQATFYYYKRWIWMIFPWICLSVNKQQTFSDLISKCYSSNIRYLSVEEEK